MSVHIGEMTSEVTVVEGELPLSPAQIQKLVRLVASEMERAKRSAQKIDEATRVQESVAPPMSLGK